MYPLIYDPIYSHLPLPERHRFPVQKYRTLYERLLAAGLSSSRFLRPKPVSAQQLGERLCPRYLSDFVDGKLDAKAMRRIGFPWSQHLVNRTFTAVAGTLLAGTLSLEKGRAINLTGGYHHAFYDYGAGFCIINDLYLSACNLLRQPRVDRVLIFDCDVHQGDGTASLARHEPRIFTVSLHGEKNFPFRKEQSDLDIALPKGTSDDAYLASVERALSESVATFRPDAVIYDAGVDIHQRDELGHFEISDAGIYARDKMVFDFCDRAGLPVSAVIGGGYQRDIPALVDAHYWLFKAALDLP